MQPFSKSLLEPRCSEIRRKRHVGPAWRDIFDRVADFRHPEQLRPSLVAPEFAKTRISNGLLYHASLRAILVGMLSTHSTVYAAKRLFGNALRRKMRGTHIFQTDSDPKPCGDVRRIRQSVWPALPGAL
jgi:hypothetical protein